MDAPERGGKHGGAPAFFLASVALDGGIAAFRRVWEANSGHQGVVKTTRSLGDNDGAIPGHSVTPGVAVRGEVNKQTAPPPIVDPMQSSRR